MPESRPIRIGTRGSRLALAQAEWTAQRLRAVHGEAVTTEVVVLKTRGDKLQHLALAKLDDKGFFTREIEQALLDSRVDVAVHSLKDLPSEQPPGLALGAIPEREDPADLLVTREPVPDGVPVGFRIGTSSLRRQIQALELWEGAQVTPVRGNVPTRVERLREGRMEGLLLAAAGIRRLGLSLDGLEVLRLPPKQFVPAPGQGALGLQVRTGDSEVRKLLEPLHHEETARAVEAERLLLQEVGGGCNLPLGVWVHREGDQWTLVARLGPRGWYPDLKPELSSVSFQGGDPRVLAEQAWQALERVWKADPAGSTRQRVIVTASEGVAQRQASALRSRGLGVVVCPLIETEVIATEQELEDSVSQLGPEDWLLFTSPTAARCFLERVSSSALPLGLRVAAMGPATAQTVASFGLSVEWVSEGNGSADFVDAFPACQTGAPPEKFLLPCAETARDEILGALEARRHEVRVLRLYRTRPCDLDVARIGMDVEVDFVVFSSPSAVMSFCRLGTQVPGRPIALGPATAEAVVVQGLPEPLVAERPDPEALVALVCGSDGTGV